jgi:hypothetical protein
MIRRLGAHSLDQTKLIHKMRPRILYPAPFQRIRFQKHSVLGVMLNNFFNFEKDNNTFKIREINNECDNESKLTPNSQDVVEWLMQQKFAVTSPTPIQMKALVGSCNNRAFNVNIPDMIGQDTTALNFARQKGIDIASYNSPALIKTTSTFKGWELLYLPYAGNYIDVSITDETTIDTQYLEQLHNDSILKLEVYVHNYWTREYFPFAYERMTKVD